MVSHHSQAMALWTRTGIAKWVSGASTQRGPQLSQRAGAPEWSYKTCRSCRRCDSIEGSCGNVRNTWGEMQAFVPQKQSYSLSVSFMEASSKAASSWFKSQYGADSGSQKHGNRHLWLKSGLTPDLSCDCCACKQKQQKKRLNLKPVLVNSEC